jgi:hypothetical protein
VGRHPGPAGPGRSVGFVEKEFGGTTDFYKNSGPIESLQTAEMAPGISSMHVLVSHIVNVSTR